MNLDFGLRSNTLWHDWVLQMDYPLNSMDTGLGWNGLAGWDLEGDFNQEWKKDAELFFRTKIVRDVASGGKISFSYVALS